MTSSRPSVKPDQATSDSLQYSLARYAELKPKLKFPIEKPEIWPAWRTEARAKLSELIGLPQPLSEPRSAIQVRYEPAVARPGYIRQMIRFETRPGLEAVAGC
jgi:hypothetical protein